MCGGRGQRGRSLRPRGLSPSDPDTVRSRLRGGRGTGRVADDPGRHIWGRGLDPTEDERTFGKYGTTTAPRSREGSGTDQLQRTAEDAAESERSRDWDSGSCSPAAGASDRPPHTRVLRKARLHFPEAGAVLVTPVVHHRPCAATAFWDV